MAAPAQLSRLSRHLQLLGILWMVASVLKLFGAGVLYVLGHVPSLMRLEVPFFGMHFIPALFTALSGILLIGAILGFAAGYGLMQHEPWARMLAIVLGILALFRPIFGTALGIYTLWVLLPAQSDEEYRRLAGAA